MELSKSEPDYDVPAEEYTIKKPDSTDIEQYEIPSTVYPDKQRVYTLIPKVNTWEYCDKHELNSTYLFEKNEANETGIKGTPEAEETNLKKICIRSVRSAQGVIYVLNLVVTLTMVISGGMWKAKAEEIYSTDRMGQMWRSNFSDSDINVDYCLAAAVVVFLIEICSVMLVLMVPYFTEFNARTMNILIMVVNWIEVILIFAAVLLCADTQYIPGRLKELKLLTLASAVIFLCCKVQHVIYTIEALREQAIFLPIVCLRHDKSTSHSKDPESMKSTLSTDSCHKLAGDRF